MAHDLMSSREADSDRLQDPGWPSGRPRDVGGEPRRTSSEIPDLTRLRPFADFADARRVVRTCRSVLARYVEPKTLVDDLLVIVAARVIDETTGDHLQFVAQPGEPRVSAGRFDALIASARDRLNVPPTAPTCPEIDLPEIVAHEIMRVLERCSFVLTAGQGDGRAILRALFAEVLAGSHPEVVGPAFTRFVEELGIAELAVAWVESAAAEPVRPSDPGTDPTIIDLTSSSLSIYLDAPPPADQPPPSMVGRPGWARACEGNARPRRR